MIIWSFENLIACTITLGSKHTSFPKWKNQTSPKMCAHGSVNSQGAIGEEKTSSAVVLILQQSPSNVPRSGDYLALWKFYCLYDDYGVKTHFVPQIEESDPAQSVPLEASTRKWCFERKKFHPRRYSFCNKPLQTSGDRVIIWSFESLIACTITMGSKHTSFPKLKKQTSPKVCPWKRQLARSDLRGKNFIRGGTHFATIPFKCPEIW